MSRWVCTLGYECHCVREHGEVDQFCVNSRRSNKRDEEDGDEEASQEEMLYWRRSIRRTTMLLRLDLEIDTEELEALIDFHRTMIDGAVESGEHEEAKRRRERIKLLEAER